MACWLSGWEDLGVGQAREIIDGDMDVLPAGRLASDAERVGSARAASPVGHAGDPGSRAALDPTPAFDVGVDQLTGPLALIPLRSLEANASESAHPDPGQNPRSVDRGMSRTSAISRPVEPRPSQRGDRLDPLLVVRCTIRCSAEDRSRSPGSPSAR